MKTPLLLALLFWTISLTGCAQKYVITLRDGRHITTTGKPKLQGDVYVAKDINGQPFQLPAGRVMEIAPASMVEEKTSRFTPKTR